MTARPAPPLGFKIALSLIALLMAFAICEIGARLYFPRPPDDTRQPQIVYRSDPEVGYVISPSQQGWSNDGFMTVNALGFRGAEVALPKPAGRRRIVLLGDSVTVGLGVGDQDTFGAQLESELRRGGHDVDVVNLAVSGYNTRQEVGLLARHLARLEPDLVLLGFYINDVEGSVGDNAKDTGTRIAAESAAPGQILHMEVSGGGWWNRRLRSSRAVYLLGRIVSRFSSRGEWGSSRFMMEQAMLQGQEPPELERGWTNVEKALGDLKTLTAGRIPVGVIILPCKEQVTRQYDSPKYEQRVRGIVEKQTFFPIDPLPALSAEQPSHELFVPYDRNHLNPAGHRVVAHAIAVELEKRRSLTPSATNQ